MLDINDRLEINGDTYVRLLEQSEPPPADLKQAWVLPDPLLPPYHEYFPVRVTAPAPCVLALDYPYAIEIDEPWQRLIGDSLSYSRYGASFDGIGGRRSAEGQRIIHAFEHLLATGLAFANGDAGFGGATPKTNVLSGYVGEAWPRYDKVRICGAITLYGEIDGNDFIFDAYDYEKPPTLWGNDLNADRRMFEATQIYSAGAVRVFPGLDTHPQYLPLMRRKGEPLRYSLAFVQVYTGPRRAPYYTPGEIEGAWNWVRWAARRVLGGSLGEKI